MPRNIGGPRVVLPPPPPPQEHTYEELCDIVQRGDMKALASRHYRLGGYGRAQLVRRAISHHRPAMVKELMTFAPSQNFFLFTLREAARNPENPGAQACLDLVLEANGDEFEISKKSHANNSGMQDQDAIKICIEADNEELFDWCLRQRPIDINRHDPLHWAMNEYTKNPYYLNTLLAHPDVRMYHWVVLWFVWPYLWLTGTTSVMSEASTDHNRYFCHSLWLSCIFYLGLLCLMSGCLLLT